MNQRLLASLALFVVVVVLAIFFVLSDSRSRDPDYLRLSDLRAESIDTVHIHRPGRADISFTKKQGLWFLDSPYTARADSARINAMLGVLGSRSFSRIKRSQAELEAYQLEPPALTLRLQDHEFHFGTTDPLDERRYVMFENTIHLVNDSLFHQLNQAPEFYVSRKLVAAEEIITGIQFAGILVSKIGTGWSLSPADDSVREERLHTLAEAWQNGKARQLRQYKRTGKTGKIVLSFRSGTGAVFDIISSTPNLVLGRADLALEYHLDKDTAEKLFLPLQTTDE